MTLPRWDEVADLLRGNKGSLGDLGGGNHFLDALEPYDGQALYFLIHTGSRSESGLVDGLVEQPASFDREFERIVSWAEANRAAIQKAIESVFGACEVVLDLPHNSCERLPDGGVIIRKGAVRVEPGDLTVLPSSMAGDVALAEATYAVREALCSLSHGTGRVMPRGESKQHAEQYDFAALRKRIIIPAGVSDASLRTEGPYAYRDLDACLTLLSGYMVVRQRFAVIAYMGHL